MTDAETMVVRDALEKALHALVTHQGCIATDRPDLMGQRPLEAISWPIDETPTIQAVHEALTVLSR